MKVSEAVESRMSVRAFSDKPVSNEILREVLAKASRTPSGGNLQPWRAFALNGEPMQRFKMLMHAKISDPSYKERPAHLAYPDKLKEPYRSNRYKCGMDLYAALDIKRGEREKRLEQFIKNFDFFGAPAACMFYIDKQMEQIQWADMGMMLQTIMLLLREAGLDSCAQGAWCLYPGLVGDFVGADDDLMLVCGMAIGYRDQNAPVNDLIIDRHSADDWVNFVE